MSNKKPMFDFVIGNPPYQEPRTNTSDAPIYHHFMEAAYRCANVVETITPGRFLFNAGKTPKEWNEKMLADEHLKVVMYEQDSAAIFPTTDIKGGIAIILRNKDHKFGAIDVFAAYEEMRTVYKKIKQDLENNGNLSDIMVLQNKYNTTTLFAEHPELPQKLSNDGKERRLVSSCFEKNPCFTNNKVADDDICVLGILSLARTYKYLPKKYIEDNGNLYKYKVLVPNSNGSGAVGEVMSTPLIGTPLIGYTQSFIGIGAFDTLQEAEAALKYVKTKFCRLTLGLLKATQSNSPDKWQYVPLQDFTAHSDVDWSQSVANIDQQLYTKYGLSQNEIDFIESHVKEME